MILALGCLIHALTIVVVWSVGRAQGLVLPVSDAAVLFTVMLGVALVPISISGWGLRELAVISLLGNHGIAPEQALLFSVCFGLVLAARFAARGVRLAVLFVRAVVALCRARWMNGPLMPLLPRPASAVLISFNGTRTCLTPIER